MSNQDPKFDAFRAISYSKNPLVCSGNESLQEVAIRMQARNAGSILIAKDNTIKGILTDTDLRRAAAIGISPKTTPASDFMIGPVVTCEPEISAVSAMHQMLRSGISHLVITQDGSDCSKLLGIVSQRDLLIQRGENPEGILFAIAKAETLNQLSALQKATDALIRYYLKIDLNFRYLSEIRTLINDAVTAKLINWAIQKYPLPTGVILSWLAVGSMGRGEQVFPTDQDNAMVFSDVAAPHLEKTRRTMLSIAESVNRDLATLGFEYCPANMMAKNPKYCLSLSEWKNRFGHWIDNTDEQGLLQSTIFFDFRTVYGDPALELDLRQEIYNHLRKHPLFLNYLGLDAVQNPKALGFMGRIKRERQSAQKGRFDLKARLMLPLIDAARVLILATGLEDPKNTWQRYLALGHAEPQNAGIFLRAAEAFNQVAQIRAQNADRQNGNSRYLPLRGKDQQNQDTIRQIARVIDELQKLIVTRFQLAGML